MRKSAQEVVEVAKFIAQENAQWQFVGSNIIYSTKHVYSESVLEASKNIYSKPVNGV